METVKGYFDLGGAKPQTWQHRRAAAPYPGRNGEANGHAPDRSPEHLRRVAWQVGERRAAESYRPAAGHVALGMVTPREGLAHWRIPQGWVEDTRRRKGPAWNHCRLVLRLYDVTFIEFNGFNAHRTQDHDLPGLEGQFFFRLPGGGTWQLGEVGFLLRSGEFVPAARSRPVPFAPDGGTNRGGGAALLVTAPGRVEEVGNVWDGERILRERSRPRLRPRLRIAGLAFASLHTGQQGPLATFVTELAAGQAAHGHEVHVFVPAGDGFDGPREVDGVVYQPLEVPTNGTPVEVADAFAQAADQCLRELPPFDLLHLHEWMAGLVAQPGGRPTVLSLGSIEATRRNGTAPTPLSLEVQRVERALARSVDCLLVPHWLRDRALEELAVDPGRVHPFPMEGRLANEWECPLDYGQVKRGVGVGPLDRMILFVGPLEHAAGVDILLEALPTLLNRVPNLRLAYVGAGNLWGHLEHRAHQLGVAHAVRLLGHVEGPQVHRLVRAAEAVVQPSRYRVPFDDAVVDLARKAGRPVVTTMSGPAHLVRHEENGLVTYDNPGSMVWALDRILGDPGHAERMGQKGRRGDGSAPQWSEVARHYLQLCAEAFPALSETSP
jgi:glycosyltransferase involved in cell wall biosynthesis